MIAVGGGGRQGEKRKSAPGLPASSAAVFPQKKVYARGGRKYDGFMRFRLPTAVTAVAAAALARAARPAAALAFAACAAPAFAVREPGPLSKSSGSAVAVFFLIMLTALIIGVSMMNPRRTHQD